MLLTMDLEKALPLIKYNIQKRNSPNFLKHSVKSVIKSRYSEHPNPVINLNPDT